MKWSVAVSTLLVVACIGCSKPSAEEYYAKAEAAEQAKNYSQALETYSALVRDYPKAPQAEAALFKIAEIHHSQTKDLAKTIDAYQRYLTLFPDGEKAPGAMFTIAFIYNNELHNLDSAAAVYRRFLDKYPHNELASAALYELNNLGKSPDELIPPDATENKPPPAPPVKEQGRAKEKKNT